MIFSRGGPKYFCREGKSGKIRFSPLETKKTTFFEKNVMGRCQISKSWSGLGPPSNAHAPKTSFGKKTEEDSKNTFTNRHIMIFEVNIH